MYVIVLSYLIKLYFICSIEASKFFLSTQTKSFYKSLERNKIKGTFYINQRTRTVAFVNKSNSKCKTIIQDIG